MFKVISNAYAILSNENKKKDYDSFLNSRPVIKPKKQKDESVLDSVDTISDQINILLWDIEDFLTKTSAEYYKKIVSGKPLHFYIIRILDFIDKWIFEPNSYEAYLDGIKSRSKIQILNYFYHLRIRIDKLFKELTFEDLLKTVTRSHIKKIDCIFEIQRHTIYYLNYLHNDRPFIPDYQFIDYTFDL